METMHFGKDGSDSSLQLVQKVQTCCCPLKRSSQIYIYIYKLRNVGSEAPKVHRACSYLVGLNLIARNQNES